jgi:NAD(P)-dependent dehydrogenase (short-subunit alcohol dehydrogenase family)
MFARYLTQTKPRLDILINNAAQTVRRPPGFSAHMLADEEKPFSALAPGVQSLLRGHEACKRAIGGDVSLELTEGTDHGASAGFVAWRGEGPGTGIRASAQLSQVPCAFDDPSHDQDVFPEGRVDADLQQVDLRTMNSWRMTLSQVPSPEMLEVQLVNAVAPFILCSKLKELMMRHPSHDKHIVNVSAMEGQFARRVKTDKHPHTNMAKAALNMLTRTSAEDYAADAIYMNSVDTGWISNENPRPIADAMDASGFAPPLDLVDAAARVCDPIVRGLRAGERLWGLFLKDFRAISW